MKYYFMPDRWVIAVTLVSMVLIWSMWRSVFAEKWYFVVIIVLVTLLLLYFFAKVPVSVSVDREKIKVNQIVGTTVFKRDNIKLLPLHRNDLDNTLRRFGNGGLGGYVGWFSSPRLGKFYMLAVNRKELAKIITESGKIYVINYPSQLLDPQ